MLNNYDFKSFFKDELNYFIKYKRSSGLKYENEIFRLKYIDNILYNLNLKTKKITKETFFKLIERNNMHGENYARQYGVTKAFCKFLITNGYKNIYYENKKFNVINNYKPVIFSDDEIIILFRTIDEYKNQCINKKYYKLYYSYSILFRLLYACGLRVSEVAKMTTDNINFSENTINIIDSKRHISRLVVFSNSMKICLENYIKLFNIENGLLFKNSRNKMIRCASIRKYYRNSINKIITTLVNDLKIKYPTYFKDNYFPHSFRHTKATHLYNNGTPLLYVKEFLGHNTISSTEKSYF